MSMGDLYLRITGADPTEVQVRRMERIRSVLHLSSNDAMLALVVVEEWFLEEQIVLVRKMDKMTNTIAKTLNGHVDDRLKNFETEILARLDGRVIIDKWLLRMFVGATAAGLLAFAIYIFTH